MKTTTLRFCETFILEETSLFFFLVNQFCNQLLEYLSFFYIFFVLKVDFLFIFLLTIKPRKIFVIWQMQTRWNYFKRVRTGLSSDWQKGHIFLLLKSAIVILYHKFLQLFWCLLPRFFILELNPVIYSKEKQILRN